MKRLMKSKRSPSTKLSQKSGISEKSCRSVSPYKYARDNNLQIRKFDHSNKKASKNTPLRSSSKKRYGHLMDTRTSLSKKRNSRNYPHGFKTE